MVFRQWFQWNQAGVETQIRKSYICTNQSVKWKDAPLQSQWSGINFINGYIMYNRTHDVHQFHLYSMMYRSHLWCWLLTTDFTVTHPSIWLIEWYISLALLHLSTCFISLESAYHHIYIAHAWTSNLQSSLTCGADAGNARRFEFNACLT